MSKLVDVQCPSCGKSFTAKPGFEGKRGKCPTENCDGVILIPAAVGDAQSSVTNKPVTRRIFVGDADQPTRLTRTVVLVGVIALLGFAVQGWIGDISPSASRKASSTAVASASTSETTGPASVAENSATKLELKATGSPQSSGVETLLPPRTESVPLLLHQEGDVLPIDFPGATQGVKSVFFTPDGTEAFTVFHSHGNSVLSKWNLTQGRQYGDGLVLPRGDECEWTFSPDGRFLAGTLSRADHGVILVDPVSGVIVNKQGTENAYLSAPCWSVTGDAIYFGNHVGRIARWQLDTGEIVPVASQGKSVTRVAVSSDGGYLLSGDISGEVRIWDLEHVRYVATYQGLKHPIQHLATRRYDDGVLVLVVAGRSGESWQVHLIDLQTRQPLHRTTVPGQVVRVAVSDDWRRFAVGNRGGKVSLFDLPSGRNLLSCTPHAGDVTAVSISPDGLFSLSGVRQSPEGRDVTVRLRGLPLPEVVADSTVAERQP